MVLTKKQIKQYYEEANTGMGFFTKLKMLFLHPGKFFESVKKERLMTAFILFLAFFLLSNVTTTLVSVASLRSASGDLPAEAQERLSIELSSQIQNLSTSIIYGFIISLVLFSWFHIFVRIFGGKAGIKQTLKAFMYTSIPISIVSIVLNVVSSFVFAGIYVNIFSNPQVLFDPQSLIAIGIGLVTALIILVWSVALYCIGIGKLHGISAWRGFFALLVGFAVLVIILFVLFILLLASLLASLPLGSSIANPFANETASLLI